MQNALSADERAEWKTKGERAGQGHSVEALGDQLSMGKTKALERMILALGDKGWGKWAGKRARTKERLWNRGFERGKGR